METKMYLMFNGDDKGTSSTGTRGGGGGNSGTSSTGTKGGGSK